MTLPQITLPLPPASAPPCRSSGTAARVWLSIEVDATNWTEDTAVQAVRSPARRQRHPTGRGLAQPPDEMVGRSASAVAVEDGAVAALRIREGRPCGGPIRS